MPPPDPDRQDPPRLPLLRIAIAGVCVLVVIVVIIGFGFGPGEIDPTSDPLVDEALTLPVN